MKNFINDLYFGNIRPQPVHFQRGEQYRKAMIVMTDSEKQLNNRLEGENKTLFHDYVNASDELIGVCSTETFADGFRLGAAFALDAFFGADDLYYT